MGLNVTSVFDASDQTRPPTYFESAVNTGVRMAKHAFDGPLMILGTLATASGLGGTLYAATRAVAALCAGQKRQAKSLAKISLLTLGMSACTGLYTACNIYQNVTTITWSKSFLDRDWKKFYTSTQDYNKYGERIGPRLYQYQGLCYENRETEMLCFSDARSLY